MIPVVGFGKTLIFETVVSFSDKQSSTNTSEVADAEQPLASV